MGSQQCGIIIDSWWISTKRQTQLRITHSQLHSFVAVRILLANSWWNYHGTNKTQVVLQCLALFLDYINCHKHNEYHCHISLIPYLIGTPSALSQHEGAEYKVYLLELFQTGAFSLSMYPLIPKFQGTAWLKVFELNLLTRRLTFFLVECCIFLELKILTFFVILAFRMVAQSFFLRLHFGCLFLSDFCFFIGDALIKSEFNFFSSFCSSWSLVRSKKG